MLDDGTAELEDVVISSCLSVIVLTMFDKVSTHFNSFALRSSQSKSTTSTTVFEELEITFSFDSAFVETTDAESDFFLTVNIDATPDTIFGFVTVIDEVAISTSVKSTEVSVLTEGVDSTLLFCEDEEKKVLIELFEIDAVTGVFFFVDIFFFQVD